MAAQIRERSDQLKAACKIQIAAGRLIYDNPQHLVSDELWGDPKICSYSYRRVGCKAVEMHFPLNLKPFIKVANPKVCDEIPCRCPKDDLEPGVPARKLRLEDPGATTRRVAPSYGAVGMINIEDCPRCLKHKLETDRRGKIGRPRRWGGDSDASSPEEQAKTAPPRSSTGGTTTLPSSDDAYLVYS